MRAWISPSLVERFAREQTDAYRIVTGAEGWAERLGRDLLISFKTGEELARVQAELPAWSDAAGWRPERVFGRFLPKQNAEREAPRLLQGPDSAGLEAVVQERGLHFGIDFAAGYSAGFFIDQRENRAFILQHSPRRLLNCFAYTCSFSVVAARAGASTISVDLSRKSLQRGQQNFALNELPTDGHRFLADDVLEVLPRLARKREVFDMIVLDPPTFSRGQGGRAFQVERDFEGLIAAALELAAPQSELLLSTNCTRLAEADLEQVARYALKVARRSGRFHRAPPLPDFPSGAGARTVWLAVR